MAGKTVKWLVPVLVVSICLFAGSAFAYTVLCNEGTNGCVATISGTFVGVASDGEGTFHPFGINDDVSDAINLSGYVGEGNANFHFVSGAGWVPAGAGIWALPANLTGIGCGAENETTCEPVGVFAATSGFWVASVLGAYIITNGEQQVSDVVTLYNAGNLAYISFASDPIVPEPASIMLLAIGLIGLAARGRLARRTRRPE